MGILYCSWMYRKRGIEINGLTSELIHEVNCFVRYCLDTNNGSENKMRCLCAIHKNKKFIPANSVKEHLCSGVLCLFIIIG